MHGNDIHIRWNSEVLLRLYGPRRPRLLFSLRAIRLATVAKGMIAPLLPRFAVMKASRRMFCTAKIGSSAIQTPTHAIADLT